MYYDCREDIQRDLDSERRSLIKFRRRLKELPPVYGSLVEKQSPNSHRTYYYHQTRENGNVFQRYIKKEDFRLVECFRERRTIELAIQRCANNIENLSTMLRCYESLAPKDIDIALAKAYRGSENYRQLLQSQTGARAWLNRMKAEKEKFPVYHPEELTNLACDGSYTRTKGEAMLIQALCSLDIPFIYERPIQLVSRNGPFPKLVTRVPDFTCLNKRNGKEFILEHIGLTNNSRYMDYYESKLQLYIDNSYVPYVNLLMTYENHDGKIDMPSIYKLLETFLK